ncbi:MAG: hypothetical protein KBF76_11200 [Verrucomicrobiales bacterium]|nr:hypothetical protein [Verrucomicrobiales bacterium]
MDRDLDAKPGLKIAGCVVLVVAVLVFAGPYIAYVFAWGYSGYNSGKHKNQDFEFFGQIISESGEPIEGVSFIAEWKSYRENRISWILKGAVATKSLEIESDSDGTFAIKGARGVNLHIFDFTHPSYEIAGERRFWGFSTSYSSSRTEGLSIDDPFIIEMSAKSNEDRP